MTSRRLRIAGLLVVLAGLTGCQRLSYDKSYDLEPLETRTLDFDAPRYQQKLKVEITSAGVPLSAYLVKSADKEAAEREMDGRKAPAGSLGGQDKSETISFEAAIPAGTGFCLIVKNTTSKKAQVQIKVNGR